jgi:hypothetical protein
MVATPLKSEDQLCAFNSSGDPCSHLLCYGAERFKPSAPMAFSRVRARVGDPAVIEAAAVNVAQGLATQWKGGSQEATAISGCTMTITTKRGTILGPQTDEQTFDAADLEGAEPDMVPDPGRQFMEVRMTAKGGLTPWVRRKRIIVADGVPKTVTERVVFLSLIGVVADGDAKFGLLIDGLRSYRDFCKRK